MAKRQQSRSLAEADELLKRRSHAVVFTKVKGHATWEDVRQGTGRRQDRLDNDGADRLAKIGAAKHAVPAAEARQTMSRQVVTREVQSMIVDTLLTLLLPGMQGSRSSGERADPVLNSHAATQMTAELATAAARAVAVEATAESAAATTPTAI